MLDSPLPKLHATPPEALPFATSLHVRTFLLERDAGNLLVYGAPIGREAADAIASLGPVAGHYLNHWHEAGFAGDGVGAPLLVHADDREQAAADVRVDDTFSGRSTVGDDFELIPTPGHTPGATAFLWDSGSGRVLFTGDTLYLSRGEWVAAVLDSSDHAAYVESLALLRELEFDVLMPWAATAGEPYHMPVEPADARRRIDAVLERVRRGEGH